MSNLNQNTKLMNYEGLKEYDTQLKEYLPIEPGNSGKDSIQSKQGNAIGNNSIALGNSVTASGQNAVALGNNSKARGMSSLVVGSYSEANGNSSVALGNSVIANSRNQIVVGRFNKETISVNNNSLFVVGNGAGEISRSNSFEVKTDEVDAYTKFIGAAGAEFTGDVEINGNLTVTGTSTTVNTTVENVNVENNTFLLRSNVETELNEGDYAGIIAHKYDGENDGCLVFDKTGTAYVGDEGDLQPLLTRDQVEKMADSAFIRWDQDNSKAVTTCLQEGAAPYSIILEGNNISGAKGYHIEAFDYENQQIILSDKPLSSPSEQFQMPADWAIGHWITILNYNNYDCCGQIVDINSDSRTITLTAGALVDPGLTTENERKDTIVNCDIDKMIINLTNPSSGIIDVGWNNAVFGEGNSAYLQDTIVAGLDNQSIGKYSATFGRGNLVGYGGLAGGTYHKVLGNLAFAAGQSNQALGNGSAALGVESIAKGRAAFVAGYQVQSLGNCSFATGARGVVEGYASTIEGGTDPTTTDTHYNKGNYAHVEGQANHNTGNNAHIEGDHNTNAGISSHVEGQNNIASIGIGAHIEGIKNKTSTNNAVDRQGMHIEGYQNGNEEGIDLSKYNYGRALHIEGFMNKGCGNDLHIEGSKNTVENCFASHIEGRENKAVNGQYLHVGGYANTFISSSKAIDGIFIHGNQLIASKNWQTLFGKYSSQDDDALFIIGNGTSNTNRKNLFAIRENAIVFNGNAISNDKWVTLMNIASGYDPDYITNLIDERIALALGLNENANEVEL